MALTTYTITGDLLDAIGSPLASGDVIFTPHATHDARVDGANALLGSVRYSLPHPDTITLTAGDWTIRIEHLGKVQGEPVFKDITVALNIGRNYTWGEIVGGAVSNVSVTPTALQQAQEAAAAADLSADQAAASAASVGDPVQRIERTLHAPALGVFFPEAEGAVGDGVTDDAAAINAAFVAAGTSRGTVVFAGGKTYAAAAPLIPATATSGHLEHGATIKATAALTALLDLSGKTGVRVGGHGTLDFATFPTAAGVNSSATTVDCEVTGLNMSDDGLANGVFPVNINGAVRMKVSACGFIGVTRGVRIAGANDSCTVADNFFSDWGQRAIFVIGTATEASADLSITGNRLVVPTQAADVRQPISFQGASGAFHMRPRVARNTVIGNYLAHHVTTDGVYGAEAGGTADAISLHWCKDGDVAGNTIAGSGEVGITIANGCVRTKARANTIVDSNSCGIAIGSSLAQVVDCSAVGNTLTNNGHEWSSTPVRTGVQVGVWVQNAIGGLVDGNECVDDQATPTQISVVYLKDTSAVTIGVNPRRGGTSRLVNASSAGNTLTVFDTLPRRKAKTADQIVNDSTALVNDTALSLPVESLAVYQVEAYLLYNSTTTADLSIKWAVPTATAFAWTPNSPSAGTPSATGDVNRIGLLAASQITVGGGGAPDMVALPTGTLTVGATSGNLTLQFAQATAEVSDTILRAGSWIKLTRIG